MEEKKPLQMGREHGGSGAQWGKEGLMGTQGQGQGRAYGGEFILAAAGSRGEVWGDGGWDRSDSMSEISAATEGETHW